MQRIGQTIHLNPEKRALYCQLHANPWKDVSAQIARCNIRNYSIFLSGDTLFSYFEYVGEDFEADMKRMGEDEATRLWWSLTDPCQTPVKTAKEGEWWSTMDEVFHQD